MEIKKSLQSIPSPQIYKKNKIKRYLDPFRNRLVSITPEETVRQKVACYIRDYMKAPADQIIVEDHLSHYGVNSRERADIIIKCTIGDLEYPLAIIECKSEAIGISDQTVEQVTRYADTIEAKYVFVCDGIEIQGYVYDKITDSYKPLNNIPTYDQMLSENYILEEENNNFFRASFDNLSKPQEYDSEIIGEDTPEVLKPFIRNLADAMLDCSHMLVPAVRNNLSIIQDLGLSYRRYGDASGGNFGTGAYRMVLTKDKDDETMIYGFSVLVTGKTINHPKYGNRLGQSVLVVSVSGENKDEMVVQINLNKYLRPLGNCFVISHNGKVSLKNASIQELKQWILSESPSLISGIEILLGTLPSDRLLYMDMKCMNDLIINLIQYCKIRERYKKHLSQKNRKNK